MFYPTPATGDNYAGSPNNYNNTLQGSSATGWIETQPDGTTFNYDSSGVFAHDPQQRGRPLDADVGCRL